LLGFAMGMGSFDPDVRADDLYVLARSPEGELGAVMRFVAHPALTWRGPISSRLIAGRGADIWLEVYDSARRPLQLANQPTLRLSECA
jgi:hypothetical protein